MRRMFEVEEFEKVKGMDEHFAGTKLDRIVKERLPVTWSWKKCRRFMAWFVLKGLMQGWLLDELGCFK